MLIFKNSLLRDNNKNRSSTTEQIWIDIKRNKKDFKKQTTQ